MACRRAVPTAVQREIRVSPGGRTTRPPQQGNRATAMLLASHAHRRAGLHEQHGVFWNRGLAFFRVPVYLALRTLMSDVHAQSVTLFSCIVGTVGIRGWGAREHF